MRKIPTLFIKQFDANGKYIGVSHEVTPGCELVFEHFTTPTLKVDGAACMIKDMVLYKRYDAKRGKSIPKNAIPCQDAPDEITGHFPVWIPVNPNDNADKWFIEAYRNYTHTYRDLPLYNFNGTFEAVGKHFNGNPYNSEIDTLYRHGSKIITDIDKNYTYESIRDYLSEHYIEGIVFWFRNEPLCKIRRIDFGFEWNKRK